MSRIRDRKTNKKRYVFSAKISETPAVRTWLRKVNEAMNTPHIHAIVDKAMAEHLKHGMFYGSSCMEDHIMNTMKDFEINK